MSRRPIRLVLLALALPALGGIGYAVIHAVDDRPAPAVVIPAEPDRAFDDLGGDD